MCLHKFKGGQGMMGDAVTCKKCGYSKYPEVLSWWGWICLKLFGAGN